MAPVLGKKEKPDPWTVEEEIPILSKPSGGIKAKIELVKMNLEGPILANPRILYLMGVKMEKNGFIGELENKLCVFLVGTTKDYERDDRMGLVIGGESGVGKSWMLRILETYFGQDVQSISRMSAHAPDYMQGLFPNGTCDGMILLIKQMEGAEESSYTVMIMADPISGGLRLLTVEDKKIKERVLKGMPVVCTSSVRVQFDSQITRRFLDIHPDESPEQTQRIMMHEARMKNDALYRRDVQTIDNDMKEIVSKMKSESSKFGVEIPFATLIPSKIPSVILARTDIKKIFGMIVAVTHLFYQDRFRYVNPLGAAVLIASPADYYLAWTLVGKTISKRLSGISDDRVSRLLKALDTIDPSKKGVSSAELHEEVSIYAKSTIYGAMKELANQGYVTSEKDQNDRRKSIYTRTNKTITPIDVRFPDEEIEKEYVKFVKEKLGKDDAESDRKHVLPANLTDLLKKSMLVFESASGRNITREVISEKTFREYNLGDVSV